MLSAVKWERIVSKSEWPVCDQVVQLTKDFLPNPNEGMFPPPPTDDEIYDGIEEEDDDDG
jgi:hypothetical protein